MYNKLHFYAFLCRYNYVLLVSCWIGFSLVFRVCCLFSVLCFRMLTLPYLVSIPQFHFKAIQHKGGISYSFSGVGRRRHTWHVAVPCYSHIDRRPNEANDFSNRFEELLHYIGFTAVIYRVDLIFFRFHSNPMYSARNHSDIITKLVSWRFWLNQNFN